MISCKKATELVENQFERNLSIKERIQLKLHLFSCKLCHIYAKQSKTLQQYLKKYFTINYSDLSVKNASKALKHRIVNEIDKFKTET